MNSATRHFMKMARLRYWKGQELKLIFRFKILRKLDLWRLGKPGEQISKMGQSKSKATV